MVEMVEQLQDNNDRIEVLLERYQAHLGFVVAVVAELVARDLEDGNGDSNDQTV